MKKILGFLVLALLIASPAFALQCKQGNFGSDECWTNVKVSDSETNPVIAGTILVYDFASSTSSDDSAFNVRVSSASADNYRVAGVAQNAIATGKEGLVLVRGKGKIKIVGVATSADRLWVSATAGKAGTQFVTDSAVATNDRPIAIALTTTTITSTADAYITVV